MADKKSGYGNLPHGPSPGISGAVSDAVESVKRFVKVRMTPTDRKYGPGGMTADEVAAQANSGDLAKMHKNQHADQ